MEQGDKPCEIEVVYHQSFTGKDVNKTGHKFRQHACSGLGKSHHSVFVNNSKNQAVHGVGVCLNAGKTRLKGIRLYMSKVYNQDKRLVYPNRLDGYVVKTNQLRTDKLGNCTVPNQSSRSWRSSPL